MMAQCVRPQGLLFKQWSANSSEKLKKEKLKQLQSKAQEMSKNKLGFW